MLFYTWFFVGMSEWVCARCHRVLLGFAHHLSFIWWVSVLARVFPPFYHKIYSALTARVFWKVDNCGLSQDVIFLVNDSCLARDVLNPKFAEWTVRDFIQIWLCLDTRINTNISLWTFLGNLLQTFAGCNLRFMFFFCWNTLPGITWDFKQTITRDAGRYDSLRKLTIRDCISTIGNVSSSVCCTRWTALSSKWLWLWLWWRSGYWKDYIHIKIHSTFIDTSA